MKVLFFMSHGVLARNFEWVLRELADRGHRVHVALDRLDKPGVSATNRVLEAVTRDCPGITFGAAPARRLSDRSSTGRAFRLVLDFLRYLEPEYIGADKPRARMAARMPRLFRLLSRPLLAFARGRAVLRGLLALGDEGTPVAADLRRFVLARAPDAILITPLVDPGSPQTDYVRCARSLGIPSMLAVHSWDNLTVKGGIHEAPDLVAVWNEAQRQEAIALHDLPAERVIVTGAAAYDHWFSWKPSGREEFCRSMHLDPAQPFLLYLGSSRFIAPDEAEFIREWDARIRELSPELAEIQVLIRAHPLNPFPGSLPTRARLLPTSELEPFDEETRSTYFDAIYHSAAVVGVLTTAMIEAAIVNRPIHSVLVDRYRETQTGTLHFRHLLPESGGMLIVGSDYEEHARQLTQSLAGSRSDAANRSFVDSFIRPPGPAERAASSVADAVEALATLSPAPALGSPARRAAAWLVAVTGFALLRAYLGLHDRSGAGREAAESPRPVRPVRDV